MLVVQLRSQPARRGVRRGDSGEVWEWLPSSVSLLYSIEEGEAGRLLWRLSNPPIAGADGGFDHPEIGYLAFRDVTAKDAEILTGLEYPASMDRLRELVQEGGFLSEVKP